MASKRNQKRRYMVEDRVSELPEDVILQILSRLPTVAAIRTGLLSKRWRRIWTLVTTVDIDSFRDIDYFARGETTSVRREKLIRFTDKCLSYPFPNTPVSGLKFRMELEYVHHVDRWLRSPILKNVKELELAVGTKGMNPYTLPEFILHLRGLTSMRLSSYKYGEFLMKTDSPVCLPLLKELCLEHVGLDNQTLNNLLSGCTSLERLSIHSCHGLSDPELSSSSLKHMVFCPPLDTDQEIEVKAINLQSFEFRGDYHINCSVDLVQCRAIKNLSVTRRCLDDQCLTHFYLSGISMSKISVNAPHLVNADVRICHHRLNTYDKAWYGTLIKFLSQFNGFKSVNMFCSSIKALSVPIELRKKCDPPLPDLKYLKVKTNGSALHKKNTFKSSLLWIAPSFKRLIVE